MIIDVGTAYSQREMIAADLVPGVIGGDPESARDREYRQKQEALKKAEHDRDQEQARRLREVAVGNARGAWTGPD